MWQSLCIPNRAEEMSEASPTNENRKSRRWPLWFHDLEFDARETPARVRDSWFVLFVSYKTTSGLWSLYPIECNATKWMKCYVYVENVLLEQKGHFPFEILLFNFESVWVRCLNLATMARGQPCQPKSIRHATDRQKNPRHNFDTLASSRASKEILWSTWVL